MHCSSKVISPGPLEDIELIGRPESCKEETVSRLKSRLRSLLVKHKGSTKHMDVLRVIEELSEHNPSRVLEDDGINVFHSPLFCGEFLTATSPSFPGRIKKGTSDDRVQYTLGRLSFNIFQPAKLVCTLLNVRNQIVDMSPLDECSTASWSSSSLSQPEQEEERRHTYHILCDIIIHTPKGDLPAVLRNEGVCYPDNKNKDKSERVMVSFSGGTLMPAKEMKENADKLKLWEETFQDAYKQAAKERSIFDSIVLSVLTWVLGLSMPTDETLSQHTFNFNMKRAPVGYADMLFLDEDMRITVGNKGTFVVADRFQSDRTDRMI